MTHAEGTKEDCEVLIAGGGLVGLAAAMFFAQQGLDVTVVERHKTVSQLPKARGMSIRTMELFHEAGIEEVVRAAGEQENTGALAPSLVGEWIRIFDARVDPDPGGLSPQVRADCEQFRLEPILRRRAEELGAKMLFGFAVTAVEQDAASATAHVEPADGGEAFSIRGRYLVIAEGANGTLRQPLGFGRHGEEVPGTGLSVRFQADLQPLIADRPPISAVVLPKRAILLLLRGKARDHNLLMAVPQPGLDLLQEDFSDEKVIPLIREVVGSNDFEIDIEATGLWYTGAYVADQYRIGNVFLVGDAAHIMPPNGGYGANTGIAEAHNLAWKLAAVLRGEANESLLDTYETERLPIADYTVTAVLEFQKARTGFVGEQQPGPSNVTVGFRYPVPGAKGYDPQMPTLDPVTATGEPGTRVPHVTLSGNPTTTIELVDPRGFVLLSPEASAYTAALRAEPIPGVTLRAVADDSVINVERWRRIFPAPQFSALLLRPDGVIATRFDSADGDLRAAVARARIQALRPRVGATS